MISVYTDGSSMGVSNKPGGWAYVIVKDGTQQLLSGYGGSGSTTNNIMELQAAIEGLRAVIANNLANDEELELVSDSQYVLGLASGEYKPKKNVSFAVELRRLAIKTGTTFRWVRGHNNDTYNEMCDILAKQGKEENTL